MQAHLSDSFSPLIVGLETVPGRAGAELFSSASHRACVGREVWVAPHGESN